MLGRGYLSHYSEYALSLLYQYTLLYKGIIMRLSYATVDFYLFYDGAAVMKI